MWFAGSTNDIPFETLNGLQLPTSGSKTVSVPEATTTATGAPWTCQPKLPPGATRYDSRIVVPVWAWIVVAWIFPTAIALATIGASFPNDGAAAARAAAGLWAQNLLMCSSVRSQVRSSRAHWTSGKRLEQEADVCERCEESAVVYVPHSGNRSGDPTSVKCA